VYSFEHASQPMEVLAQIVQIYVFCFKMTAFFLFILFFIGAPIYENIIWVMLGGILSGVLVTLQMKDAVQNLIYIAISNPFYLGEIIALMPKRGPMPDDPSKCLTGFVEAVTLTHVVIRDFGRRQVWVPHDNFEDYNVANWTRRPSKMAMVHLTVSPHLADAPKVAQLANFLKQWIDTHPKIDQSYYRKAALVRARDGLHIEAIFYPIPGERMIPLRERFIVTAVAAANRLELTLVPNELRNQFPPTAQTDQGETRLDDLLVSIGAELPMAKDVGGPSEDAARKPTHEAHIEAGEKGSYAGED